MFSVLKRRDFLTSALAVGGAAALGAFRGSENFGGGLIGSAEAAVPSTSDLAKFKSEVLPRKGSFATMPLFGPFDPVVADSGFQTGYFGLQLDGTWPYGGVRTESGKQYALLRKVTMETTNYLVILGSDGTAMRLDPRSGTDVMRGGFVKRSARDGYNLIEGSEGAGRPGFDVKLGYDDFSWTEKGVLSFSGKRFAPGSHIYVPWREEEPNGTPGGCYYTSVCYLAEGEIFGERAKGFFIVDQDYLVPGLEWNDDRNLIWSQLQLAWVVFATEWDDGTIEWGHISAGFDKFKFGSVYSNKSPVVVETRNVSLSTDWGGPDGYAKRLKYDFDGGEQKWEFVTAADGKFSDLHYPQNWHGACGIVRRVGERRKPVRWFAWQETFPEKLGWQQR